MEGSLPDFIVQFWMSYIPQVRRSLASLFCDNGDVAVVARNADLPSAPLL